MQTSSQFWNKAAKKYAKMPIKDKEGYEATLEQTRSHLNKDDKVLEIGCGTGTTALKLSQDVNHITAIDYSIEMIEIAKGKEQQVENVDFIQSDLTTDQFANNSFDAILAFNLIHLLQDPEQDIQRLSKLLKPGGIFISKTAFLGQGFSLFRPIIPIMRLLGLAPYVKVFKTSDLEQMFKNQGFKIIDTKLFAKSPPVKYMAARKA